MARRMTPEQAKKVLGIGPNQKLAPSPDMPNSVGSSYPKDKLHFMEPWPMQNSTDATFAILEQIANDWPRAEVVEKKGNYMRIEFTSRLFKFIDDVEFLADEAQKQLHFRSASRLGHSDLGANRKRMKTFQEKYQKLSPHI